MLATFFSSLSSSGAVQGITGLVGLVASAALYKLFIDFIQPWEQGIRTRNNKPDMRHLPMGWARKSTLWASLLLLLALLGLGLFTEILSGWLFLAGLITLVTLLVLTLTSWPRGENWAHSEPGIVWKVPGWFNWTHISLKREIRTPVMENASDATGLPVYLQLAYQWSRTPDHPGAQWLSWNGIENLEATMDALVMSVAQAELKAVAGAAAMSPAQQAAFVERILVACVDEFSAHMGTMLHYVSVAVLGLPPQVAGSRIIAEALSALTPDEAAEQREVLRAAVVALDATQSSA